MARHHLLNPKAIASRIIESLQDEKHPAYGQVATVDANGWPQVRTVHLRYIKERGALGFSTHIRSPKWTQLMRKPQLSGCYNDVFRLVQLRWEGPVTLIGPSSTDPKDPILLDGMWALMRKDVRTAYWQDFNGQDENPQHRCPTLGVVICRPALWDLFEMDPHDYTWGKRTIYKLRNKTWHKQNASVLHGGATVVPGTCQAP